ncbi:CLD23 protein, partial [Atractosteus spatula]|nr:CLD23 protein [Atractosteus spatula]
MRTPCVMIFGLILALVGWLFNLIATGAPAWREVRSIVGGELGEVIHQGIWDICKERLPKEFTCLRQDDAYFKEEIVKAAKGFMIASVIVTALGILLSVLGVRCWRRSPNWLLAGLGGIVVSASSLFAIIPIAWYTNQVDKIKAPGTDIRVGYCIVLGFIGCCFEFIGGGSLMICLSQLCGGATQLPHNNGVPRSTIRTVDVPDLNERPHQPTLPRPLFQKDQSTSPPVLSSLRKRTDSDTLSNDQSLYTEL